MSPLGATHASFIMGFIYFMSLRRDTASQYGEGCNISITRLRYPANYKALDSWPIRAHLASQNDELCKNRRVSERRDIEEQQYCTVCGKYCGFFNLKSHKHIALHQIHKILFFLATSYDHFNYLSQRQDLT